MQIPALIDSGSNRTLLRQGILPRELRVDNSQQHDIQALGDQVATLSLGCVELPVSLAGLTMRTKAIVVPETVGITCDLVLGIDFLREHRWEVDSQLRRLTKRFVDGTMLDIYLDEKGNYKSALRQVKCVAAAPLDLAAGEQADVPLRLDLPEQVREVILRERPLIFLEPSSKVYPISILSGVMDSKSPHVLLINHDHSSHRINSSVQLGTATSVLELPFCRGGTPS